MRARSRPSQILRWVAIFMAHVAIVVASYLGAFFLRFELSIPPREAAIAVHSLPLMIALRLLFFYRYHLFSGWWQYVGVQDVLDILKSTVAGSLAMVLVIVLSGAYPGFPRSVVVLDWLLTLQLLAGSRVLSRLLHSLVHRMRLRNQPGVLILGTGPMAQSVLRELTVHVYEKRPVGFLDEELVARTARIRGLPVLGGLGDLADVLKRESVAEVLIAIPSDQPDKIRDAIRECRATGVTFRILSSVRDYLNRPKVADLPTLEELFDTEEPSFDDSRIRDVLYQKTVLILGAGGQVGSALARLACAAQPRHLLLFDRNESPLYYLEVELLKKLQMVPLTPLMGDVLDEDRLRQVMATHRPEVVIHAASYTRPELLSANPLEVPRNNLQGTANLIRVAADFEVPRVLLLSLDECRHDVFGCISRATEHLMRRQDRSPGSIFAAIRFPSAIGAISCEVTRLALDLQRGAGPMVPSIDSRVGIVTMRSLAPLLFEAIAFAEDGDVLAVDAGRSQTFGEVIRYLRQVWDLPEVPIRISPVAPDHTHAVEIGTPTRHPRILRRRVAREPPPCVVTLMSQFFPEDKGGHLVENSGSR